MRHPDQIKQYLKEDEFKVYKLIWLRFVASQMKPAVFDQTTVDIDAKSARRNFLVPRHRIGAQVRRLPQGLRRGKDSKDEEDEELKHKLPPLEPGRSSR